MILSIKGHMISPQSPRQPNGRLNQYLHTSFNQTPFFAENVITSYLKKYVTMSLHPLFAYSFLMMCYLLRFTLILMCVRAC